MELSPEDRAIIDDRAKKIMAAMNDIMGENTSMAFAVEAMLCATASVVAAQVAGNAENEFGATMQQVSRRFTGLIDAITETTTPFAFPIVQTRLDEKERETATVAAAHIIEFMRGCLAGERLAIGFEAVAQAAISFAAGNANDDEKVQPTKDEATMAVNTLALRMMTMMLDFSFGTIDDVRAKPSRAMN